MSKIESVQKIYAYFGSGNIPAMLEHMTEDIVWVDSTDKAYSPFGGTHHGREAVLAYFQTLGSQIQFTRFEPQEFLENDSKVVAIGAYDGVDPGNPANQFSSDWVMSFGFEGPLVKHFQIFSDTHKIYSFFQAKQG